MVQSHIAGATSYEEQSLEDIAEDIERWIKYVSDISQFMIQSKQTVQSNGFWDRVTDDFQLTIVSAMRYLDTIIYDLNIVKGAIYANNISDKEVTLLHNIGNKCIEFNNEYGITYHRSDNRWKDYGNSDFKVVEAMYAEGRNMFALLIDAGNAASRLEDYVNRGVVNNNSVSINAPIEGSVQIQQNVANSEQNAKGTFDYKSIMDVLENIKASVSTEQFRNEFSSSSQEFNALVDSSIQAVQSKEEPSTIKKLLNELKSIAIKVGGSIMASGIISLIQQLPIW